MTKFDDVANEFFNENEDYSLADIREWPTHRRTEVARQTESIEILDALASDWRADVREAVAENPATSPEILARLLQDRRSYVRAEAQRNQNLTKEQLNDLSRSTDPECRENVAEHPNVSMLVLERLADDRDVYVKWAVLRNSRTPEELRDRLLEEKEGWELY